MSEKRSTGPNARPKNETIAQTGEGLPDDTGRLPPGTMEADEEAARRSLDALGKSPERQGKPGRAIPGTEDRPARKSDEG